MIGPAGSNVVTSNNCVAIRRSVASDGTPLGVVRPPGAETGVLLARADGEGQEALVGRQFCRSC